jgi:thiamine-phosphate pyrophosphorylase
VRPLPRLHAITDSAVLALDDFGIRAAALAAAGPAVALHARDRSATAARLTRVAERTLALVRPPEAALFVNGRPDLAAALGAHGLQLGRQDLTPVDARRMFTQGWIGASVHSLAEATEAIGEGADYLLVGPIYPTPSHPGWPGHGTGLVRQMVRLGLPVIAIGGVTAERVAELKAAGAYGVAAISATWLAHDPAAAALALLLPWMEDA